MSRGIKILFCNSYIKGNSYKMIKAITIDFYGTVVCEDGEIVRKISEKIFVIRKVENRGEIVK